MPKSSSLGHSLSVYVSVCSININKMNLNKFYCQFGFYSLSVSLFPSFLLSCSLLNEFHVLMALLGDSFLVSFVRSSSYMKPNNDYTLLSDVGVSSKPCLRAIFSLNIPIGLHVESHKNSFHIVPMQIVSLLQKTTEQMLN